MTSDAEQEAREVEHGDEPGTFDVVGQSTPDPAAMSDEELREACERLAVEVWGPHASLSDEPEDSNVFVGLNDTGGVPLDLYAPFGASERTALLALYAALTVLAQEGGE